MVEGESVKTSRGFYLVLGILSIGALLIRILFLHCKSVLTGDELHYAESLFYFLRGDFTGGFSDYWSFFYPFSAVPFGHIAGDAETGLRMLSLLAGSFLLIPTALIARRIAGEGVALFAALFVALHTNLIDYSTAAMTESYYSLLLLTAVYLFLRFADSGSMLLLVAAALVTAFAYMTRQEAQFVFAVFIVVVLIGRGAEGLEAGPYRRIIRAAALIALLIIFISPYLFIMHDKTGRWTAGSKASVNLSSSLIWESGLDRERFVYSLDSLGVNRRIDEVAQRSSFQVLRERRSEIARRIVEQLDYGPRLLPVLFLSPLFLFLVPLGLFGRLWRHERILDELVVMTVGVLPFFIYAFFKVQLRYLVPVLPIYLIWAGAGLEVFGLWLERVLSIRGTLLTAILFLVFTVNIPYTTHRYRAVKAAQRTDYKEVGGYIASEFPRGARVLAHSGCPVSYYAGNPRATFIPWTDVEGLVRFAEYHHFDILVVDSGYIENYRPTLKRLISGGVPPGLSLVKRFNGKFGRDIIIYSVKQAR